MCNNGMEDWHQLHYDTKVGGKILISSKFTPKEGDIQEMNRQAIKAHTDFAKENILKGLMPGMINKEVESIAKYAASKMRERRYEAQTINQQKVIMKQSVNFHLLQNIENMKKKLDLEKDKEVKEKLKRQ